MSIAQEIIAGARCDQCGRPLAESKGVPTTCRHCKKDNFMAEKRAKQAVPDGPVEFSDISRAGLGLIPGKPHLGSSFRILRTGVKVVRTEIPVTYKRNE